MVNRWHLTDEIRDKWKPIIQEWLKALENMTEEEVKDLAENSTDAEIADKFKLELSDTELNPSRVSDLLKEIGYEDEETDDNGWQWDFWWTYRKNGVSFPSGCEALKIVGTGATFELALLVDTDIVE